MILLIPDLIVRSWLSFSRIEETKKDPAVDKSKAPALPIELTLHRYAGYALATFFAGHVAAVRVVPLLYDLHVTTGLLASPLFDDPLIFYIYYPFLGIAGFYHAWYGVPKACKQLGLKVYSDWRPGTKFFNYVAVGGSLLMVSSILALGGNYFPIQLSQVERLHEVEADIAAKALKFIGYK